MVQRDRAHTISIESELRMTSLSHRPPCREPTTVMMTGSDSITAAGDKEPAVAVVGALGVSDSVSDEAIAKAFQAMEGDTPAPQQGLRFGQPVQDARQHSGFPGEDLKACCGEKWPLYFGSSLCFVGVLLTCILVPLRCASASISFLRSYVLRL